jgi:hypothetical protein
VTSLTHPWRGAGRWGALLLLAWLAGPIAPAAAEAPPASRGAEATEESEAEDAAPAFAASKLKDAAPPYPAAIQASLDDKGRDCLAEGGTSYSWRPGIVRTADLNGDPWLDFIVDWREARCVDRLTAFSGTGGWDLEIYAGRPRGEAVPVFAGRVRNYDLAGTKARRMTFHLHGSYCGRAGIDDCVKARRIGQRPFAFRDR